MIDQIFGVWNYWIVFILMMIGLYIVISKKSLLKKIVGLRQFWVRRKFEFEIFFGSDEISGLKTLGPKKMCVLKKFSPRKFWSTKIMTPKNWVQKVWSK